LVLTTKPSTSPHASHYDLATAAIATPGATMLTVLFTLESTSQAAPFSQVLSPECLQFPPASFFSVVKAFSS